MIEEKLILKLSTSAQKTLVERGYSKSYETAEELCALSGESP